MKPVEKTAQIDRMRRRSESSDLTSEGSQEDKPTNLLVATKQANGILLTQPEEIIQEDPLKTPKKESSCRIGIQVFFPFLIAGFGMVSAGMLLDYVQVRKILNTNISAMIFLLLSIGLFLWMLTSCLYWYLPSLD